MTDQFAAEHYGDYDFRTAEEVAVIAAEVEEYKEWEAAAQATEAFNRGLVAGADAVTRAGENAFLRVYKAAK